MNAVTKHEGPEAFLPADPMVSMIERVVMSPNADLDKLERMLAMKERIDAQNARVSFARALAQARAEIPPIIKDATVDFTSAKGKTHYQHETLAGIAKAIDPVLSKFGLSYRFRTGQGQGGVTVTCIIQHSDGHAEETSLAGAPDQSGNKNGFQAVGSAVTYLQRYTLKAALGLSAEVDDDGQAAAPRRDEPRGRTALGAPDDNVGQFERAVADAVRSIGKEPTLYSLGEYWQHLNRSMKGVAGDPRVIAAKDTRKAELSETTLEHLPAGAELAEEIPY